MLTQSFVPSFLFLGALVRIGVSAGPLGRFAELVRSGKPQNHVAQSNERQVDDAILESRAATAFRFMSSNTSGQSRCRTISICH